MERHIRSLEVLKQNINRDVFASMIQAKLPEEILLQLEILNEQRTSGLLKAYMLRLTSM